MDVLLHRVPAAHGGVLSRGPQPATSGKVTARDVDLSITLASRRDGQKKLSFAHPILPASGTFGYGEEFEPFIPPGTFAAVIGKSISLEPRGGNPPPRTCETAAGLLNSIGLQNPGIDRFMESYLPRLVRYGSPVIVNIVGRTVEDYCELARRLTATGQLAAIELNISCPNVKEGMQFGLDPQVTQSLVAAVRRVTDLPLIAKLTPNVTDIAEQARAAEAGGADLISLINTLSGMAVDWRTRRSRLGTATGGLSGPAIRPVGLRMVWQASRAVRIPVCAIGGVTKPEHVLEYMVVGASLVQVGTHLYRDPACLAEWVGELRELLASAGIASVQSLVGSFVPPASGPNAAMPHAACATPLALPPGMTENE